MDGKTIVEFNEITTVESGDKLLGVDISDTSASAGGTNKHFTKGNLLKEYATLVGEETLENKTLTSPVITDIDITGGSATDIDITGGSISESTNVVEVLKKVYPVGCIYTSTVSTNPNTLFGFGTWSAFGAGRTLVGIDSGDTDFDTVEETGGEKTHTLTANESGIKNHSHQAGALSGYLGGPTDTVAQAGSGSAVYIPNRRSTTTGGVDNANASEAHNNLQPYIVVHMWKRTA